MSSHAVSTFYAHPTACAAALETMKLYDDEKLYANAARLGPVLLRELDTVAAKIAVPSHVRGLGLLAAIAPQASPMQWATLVRGSPRASSRSTSTASVAPRSSHRRCASPRTSWCAASARSAKPPSPRSEGCRDRSSQDKIAASVADALAPLTDGMTISWVASVCRQRGGLDQGVIDRGVRDLTLVSNNAATWARGSPVAARRHHRQGDLQLHRGNDDLQTRMASGRGRGPR